ncbi:hypothetical protein T484DRAFT_3007264 [Baffinella frigidus]|nr:hypothetical protein T484DRAFT_3007264 [Cryptophyta sp. CCMP2293]
MASATVMVLSILTPAAAATRAASLRFIASIPDTSSLATSMCSFFMSSMSHACSTLNTAAVSRGPWPLNGSSSCSLSPFPPGSCRFSLARRASASLENVPCDGNCFSDIAPHPISSRTSPALDNSNSTLQWCVPPLRDTSWSCFSKESGAPPITSVFYRSLRQRLPA